MTTWTRLKVRLEDLQRDPARPLKSWPDPRSDEGRTSPFVIHLAAWAVDTARGLHDDFGDEVDLTVGHMSFPRPTAPTWIQRVAAGRPPPLDAADLAVHLAAAVEVPSGHELTAEVVVENRAGHQVVVRTNGHLTAMVLDPRTEEIVGAFAGAQRRPLVPFEIPPGAARGVPLLVGTASVDPGLGYAVPAGEWRMEAVLDLGDRLRRTPALPLRVTAQPVR